MRKHQKNQCADLIKTLEEAHREITKYIEKKDIQTASGLLAECQDAAVAIGGIIEDSEGEGTEAVSQLEGYCELVYQVNEEITSGQNVNPRNVEKRLRRCILAARSSINALPTRLEAVFLPYKASMWDSLESIWMAADEDENCDAYVIPIPYYDKNPDGSFAKLHYEADQYPDYVPVVNYGQYNLEERHPDMIFIHNPYDDWNLVTSVHPDFFSGKLKGYTDCLVYVPYFATSGKMSEGQVLCPAYINADYIVVQSKEMIEQYDRSIPREKFLPLGSPKFDRVIRFCNNPPAPPADWEGKMAGKRVFFYNTSIAGMLEDTGKFLRKMVYVFNTFKESKDACVLWRPHPLLESTFDSMRSEYRLTYNLIKNEYIEEAIGIYDATPDIEVAIAHSYAYIGDGGTSVTSLFAVAGKPVFLLNNNILTKPDEDDWMSLVDVAPSWDGNDRFRLLFGNKLFMRNNQYHYRYLCDLPDDDKQGLYWNALEFSGKLFVFPRNAEHILVLENDGSIRRISLRHGTDVAGKFLCAISPFGEEKYVFLLPDHYPFLVRFDTETEHIDYVEGVSGYNVVEAVDGQRLRAGYNIDMQSREIWMLNPQGTEMLCIHIDTLQKRKMKMQFNTLISTMVQPLYHSDEWYFLPYEGTDIFRWSKATDSIMRIPAGVEGLVSIQRQEREICDYNYFSSMVFADDRMVLAPRWGNKFVEIELKSHEAKEWIPPFKVSSKDRNEYWRNNLIGSFIFDEKDWLKDTFSDRVIFHYYPEHKNYSINIKTKEYEEFHVTFEKEDIYAQETGFCGIPEWMPYFCGESLRNSLTDILADNICGEEYDKTKQLKAYQWINASADGNCGENTFQYLLQKFL